ncbi:MAG: hypothetical protein V7767_11505 [Leeuwenhoekiella sp.]
MSIKGIPFESICEHPKEAQYIRVAHVCATCETTVTACMQCGTDLTSPKTDCI